MLAKQLGLRSVYVLFSDEGWRTVHASPFVTGRPRFRHRSRRVA